MITSLCACLLRREIHHIYSITSLFKDSISVHLSVTLEDTVMMHDFVASFFRMAEPYS